MTSHGPLDLLGAIGKEQTYDDLLGETQFMEIESGVAIRVLNLETLIALKRTLADSKDLASLPVLERTLREKQGRQ